MDTEKCEGCSKEEKAAQLDARLKREHVTGLLFCVAGLVLLWGAVEILWRAARTLGGAHGYATGWNEGQADIVAEIERIENDEAAKRRTAKVFKDAEDSHARRGGKEARA